MTAVPSIRIAAANDAPIRPDRTMVVYWMTIQRRLRSNFALQRAVELAQTHDVALVIFEPLRCGYRWASDRIHRFILDGMAEHARQLESANAHYFGYVEPDHDHADGLLQALGGRSVAVVTDEYPAFFLPRMTAAAGRQLDVRLEKVDSNGIAPLFAPDKRFKRAYDFRRWFQRDGVDYLDQTPRRHPLVGKNLVALTHLPDDITRRWPACCADDLADPGLVDTLPIDHDVEPVDDFPGGEKPAHDRLDRFIDDDLSGYGTGRNQPQQDQTSQLSPYLHFGHISAHDVVRAVLDREDWSVSDLADNAKGSRQGWWGVSEDAESYLDELITWREVGFNGCAYMDDYDAYDGLPDWAIETLDEHAEDPREHLYSLAEFETAQTHDDLWNAAQMQLVRQGRIHNYLRMLWGKKILHWSESPRQAFDIMVELNNKYALDGRDPNSYNGICWVLGRYDRPWGPEREIFGKIRYMTSKSTRRKYKVDDYIDHWLDV